MRRKLYYDIGVFAGTGMSDVYVEKQREIHGQREDNTQDKALTINYFILKKHIVNHAGTAASSSTT